MPAAALATDPTISTTLADARRGAACTVVGLAPGSGDQGLRLAEMGLVAGAPVEVERRAPFGDPIECRIRGYHLSLRADQARLVQVVPTDEAPEPPQRIASDLSSIPADFGQQSDLRIALAGNPNVGKTTLFNQITGLRQRIGNYPGVTVERKVGNARLPDDRRALMVDLPGIYSLCPASADERIAAQVLLGLMPGEQLPDVLCLVLDASNLARNLMLFSQAAELGLPMVVALNMVDIAAEQGVTVDPQALERRLGVPVVPVVARTGSGVLQLGEAFARARIPNARPWATETDLDTGELEQLLGERGVGAARVAALARILVQGDGLRPLPGGRGDERLALAVHRLRDAHPDIGPTLVADRYAWIDAILPDVLAASPAQVGPTRSERIDAILLHPVKGLVIFGLVMWGLFALVFTAAAPVMEVFEGLFELPGAWIAALLPEGPLRALWLDGVVAGVGGVLVFIPQIAFLFLGLSLLESSGYLARGAFLLDRALVAVGLHGKSFIPMLSSHACAIPGIMATRTINDHRDRLITMLVAPFMVCSARLPVYALLIAFFFGGMSGWVQGSVLFGLYCFGILAAVAVALVLRRTALKGRSSSFLMELPSYKWPGLRRVIRTVLVNVGHFLKRAGTIILAFSVILWALNRYPQLDDDSRAAVAAQHDVSLAAIDAEPSEADPAELVVARNAVQAAEAEHSIAGRMGKVIEPVVAPMGFDWKMGVGLIGAFAAREVFISTIGVVYATGEEEEELDALQGAMQADTRSDGTPLWTLPVGLSLLVWFALAMQCISTTAVMVRETGGWKWPILQLVGMNALAYVLCVLVYQIGSRL